MGELISGKEALIALANGEGVEYSYKTNPENTYFSVLTVNSSVRIDEIFSDQHLIFRLKPRTIAINGIEVVKPQKNMPKKGDDVFTLDFTGDGGYVSWICLSSINTFSRDWWRSEDEIKQVVAALRSIFKGE